MAKEFNFCPLCGSDTIYEDFKHHFLCKNCDYEQYLSPKPCACVILRNNQGQIGLSLRAKDPHKGTNDLVGGFIDPEEEAEEAMIREIKEEISLDIDPKRLKYFTSKHSYYQYKNWMYYTVAYIFELYLTDLEVKNIVASDDVAGLQWFEADTVPLDNMALVDAIFPMRKYLKEKALVPNDSSLEELRLQIDKVDTDIIDQLALRNRISSRVGKLKKTQNLQINQPQRWNQKLQQLQELSTTHGIDFAIVEQIYNLIHGQSKDLQK